MDHSMFNENRFKTTSFEFVTCNMKYKGSILNIKV